MVNTLTLNQKDSNGLNLSQQDCCCVSAKY